MSPPPPAGPSAALSWADDLGAAYAAAHGIDLRFSGPDEVFPAAYRVTELGAQAVAAATAAVAAFDRARTGRGQAVTVDRAQLATALRSERHLRLDGEAPPSPWGPIAGIYRTAEGGWLQIHANFDHHEAGALAVLGVGEADREAVAAAVARHDGAELEAALAAAGMCAALQRSTEAWLTHPHGALVAGLPLLDVEALGPADPVMPAPLDDRPLSGLRVLELARVIAGPVAGRFLAAHGAEVLQVDAPHLPQVEPLLADAGLGKRSCLLDLRHPADRERFLALVDGADVVIDAYRPGALATFSLQRDALVARRPGLVHVTLDAYGPVGPWGGRRGFDSLVQTATGVTHTGMLAFGGEAPVPLPCQALDHATGYLAACGAVEALRRRATGGGTWGVATSLVRTRHWLERLGLLDLTGLADPGADPSHLVDLVAGVRAGGAGRAGSARRVTVARPPGSLSLSPPAWPGPAVPLGTDEPAWLTS